MFRRIANYFYGKPIGFVTAEFIFWFLTVLLVLGIYPLSKYVFLGAINISLLQWLNILVAIFAALAFNFCIWIAMLLLFGLICMRKGYIDDVY